MSRAPRPKQIERFPLGRDDEMCICPHSYAQHGRATTTPCSVDGCGCDHFRPTGLLHATLIGAAHEDSEQRERSQKRRGVLAIARALAKNADDGRGACQWCRARLVRDDSTGLRMHPVDEEGLTTCPGPTPHCQTCGAALVLDAAGRWVEACSATHVAIAERQRAAQSAPVLKRPERVRRSHMDEPDDDDAPY